VGAHASALIGIAWDGLTLVPVPSHRFKAWLRRSSADPGSDVVRVFLDASQVDSTFELSISSIGPVRTPRILHHPIVCAAFAAIGYQRDSVTTVYATSRLGVDVATPTALPHEVGVHIEVRVQRVSCSNDFLELLFTRDHSNTTEIPIRLCS